MLHFFVVFVAIADFSLDEGHTDALLERGSHSEIQQSDPYKQWHQNCGNDVSIRVLSCKQRYLSFVVHLSSTKDVHFNQKRDLILHHFPDVFISLPISSISS